MLTYSFYYSIPYLLLLFFFFFLYANEIKKICIFSPRISRKIAFYTLVIFIGLRGHVFTDYISYYPFFDNLPLIYKLNSDYFVGNLFEPGFIVYSSVIKTVFPNYFIWIFVNTLIDLLVFQLIFRKYSYSVLLSYLVFIAFLGLSLEINLYRNSKAIALFLLSISYLKEKRFLPYLGLNLLGATFHLSAILYIPMYFILNRQVSKFFVWSFFFVTNILFLCQIHYTSVLTEYLSFWAQLDNVNSKLVAYQDGNSYRFSIGYFERLLGFLFFTFSYNKLIIQNSFNRIFYNCYLCYYFLFLFFADVQVLTERIPLLFIFSYWILYPNVLFVQRKYMKLVISIVLFTLLILKTASNTNVFCRYDNLLWGIESYDDRLKIFSSYGSDL